MSEQKQNNQSSGGFRTSIGGQALIEGIYMRGPDKQSIVVRDQNGKLVVKTEELKLTKEHYPILGIPFIRGAFAFLGTMVEGVKALMYSADFYPDEEESSEPSKFEQWLEAHVPSKTLDKLIVAFATIVAVAFSVGLFFLLPTVVTSLIKLAVPMNVLGQNVVEGIIRIAIFLAYLILISKMKDIRRVFSYHGAEHKTIFCYERGLELTVENVRKMPRHHPRCGTSFLFVVIIVSIIVSSLVFPYINWQSVWVRVGVKLLLLVPVVGITYEFNRMVGAHDNALTRVLSAPGMWLQNFTTHEPDDSMIEVAIEAMKLVIPEEKGTDTW